MVNLEIYLFKSYKPRRKLKVDTVTFKNSPKREQEFIQKSANGQTCFTSIRPLDQIENVPVHWHTLVPFSNDRFLVGGSYVNLINDEEKSFGAIINFSENLSQESLKIPISADVDSVHQIVTYKQLVIFCTKEGHLYFTSKYDMLHNVPPTAFPSVKVGSLVPHPGQETWRSLWIFKSRLFLITEIKVDEVVHNRISSIPLGIVSQLSGKLLADALQYVKIENSNVEVEEIYDTAITSLFFFILTSDKIIKLNRRNLNEKFGEVDISKLDMKNSCELICANNREIFAFNGKRTLVLNLNFSPVNNVFYSKNILKQVLRAKMMYVCQLNLAVLITWNEIYFFLSTKKSEKLYIIISPEFQNQNNGRIFDIVSINKRNNMLLVFGEFQRRTLCHISFA